MPVLHNIELEEWRDIVNYEGIYQISSLGNLRSLDRLDAAGHKLKGKEMSLVVKTTGYVGVTLCKNGKKTNKRVHRLVAEAFIENKENKTQVNHLDGNKTNNNVSNLVWSTPSENTIHAYKNGLAKANYGPGAKASAKKRSVKLKAENLKTGEIIYFDNSRLAAEGIGKPNGAGNLRTASAKNGNAYGYKWSRPDC